MIDRAGQIGQVYTIVDVTLTSGFVYKRLCQQLTDGRESKEDGIHASFTADFGDVCRVLTADPEDDTYNGIGSVLSCTVDKVRFVQGWLD